jgi:hypothetical protein
LNAKIRAMKIPMLMAAALMLSPLPASSDENFRCGQWIASVALSVEELVSKCGPPMQREVTTRDVLVRNRNNGLMVKVGESQVETWLYDRGTTAPPMVVTIVDGRIKNIERQR